MEINKEHRSALLDELEKAQDDLATQKACRDQYKGGEVLEHTFDVGCWLAQLRIDAIKTAIRDNELHNY